MAYKKTDVRRRGRRGTVGHAAAKRAKAPTRKKKVNKRVTSREKRSADDAAQIRRRQRAERSEYGFRRGRG